MLPLTLLVTLVTALSSNAALFPRQANCVTQSQPNPIAAQYPNEVTGTINGTFSVIPIPYAQARSLVPAKFGILTKAYETLMPELKGAYPVGILSPPPFPLQPSSLHYRPCSRYPFEADAPLPL